MMRITKENMYFLIHPKFPGILAIFCADATSEKEYPYG